MKVLIWLFLLVIVIGLIVFLSFPQTSAIYMRGEPTPTPKPIPTMTPTPTPCVPRHESFNVWLLCAPTPTP